MPDTFISANRAGWIMRPATRDMIRRRSLWFLALGVLMLAVGLVALVFPIVSPVVVVMLGGLLMISGLLRAFRPIGTRNVRRFRLRFLGQLIAAALSLVAGFLLLARPDTGFLALTVLLIGSFIAAGVAKIITARTIRSSPNRGWILGAGIVEIVLGVALITQVPLTTPWLLGLLVGIRLIDDAAMVWMGWQVHELLQGIASERSAA